MKLPEVLSIKQLRKFFSVVDDPKYMVIYSLAIFCGMRRESIAKLKKEDIHLEEGYIKIKDDKNVKRSKQGYGKDRTAPIPETIKPLLRLWLEYQTNSDFMFPSPFYRQKHISPNALTKKVITDLRRAGICNPHYFDKSSHKRYKYHFHTMRHTFATHYYNKTGDLMGLKENLGHTSINATQIYTHIAVSKRKETVDKVFSPVHSSLLTEDRAMDLEELRHRNKMQELAAEMKLQQMKQVKVEYTN